MRHLNLVILGLSMTLISACAMRTKILDAGAISTTHTHLKEGTTLKEMGPVSGDFCPETFGEGQFGLIDEAVKAAQKKYNVDFISNASLYKNEKGCVSIEGTGQKIVETSASSSADSKTPVKKQN